MKSIIAKLLATNDYRELSTNVDAVDTYVSEKYKDVIIVAVYDPKDLYHFDECVVTQQVMKAFDAACSENANALKDTSLVICLKSSKEGDLSDTRNVVLSIEENSFGFRKYVLPFSDSAIANLVDIQEKELNDLVYEKLKHGFSSYESAVTNFGTVDEYEVIMSLFVKLPFMKIQGRPQGTEQLPLALYMYQKLGVQQKTLDFVLTNATQHHEQVSIKSQTGYEDFDAQVDELLNQVYFQDFIKSDKGEE